MTPVTGTSLGRDGTQSFHLTDDLTVDWQNWGEPGLAKMSILIRI